VFLFLLGLSFFALNYFFSEASIVLNLKKNKIDWNGKVVVSSKKVEENSKENANLSSIYLPGQVISAEGNILLTFTGNGEEKMVEKKATGNLIVYNFYSEKDQIFVPNTRFLSPDGKIFRAVDKILLPGFKKDKNGNILPGKVEIKVIADKPGEEYNIKPQTNWKLPGLKGLPQYDKIYAENKTSMTGGFIGKKVEISDQDLENAKKEIYQKLKDSLEMKLAILNNKNFKVLEEAVAFNVKNEKIILKENNNFEFFVEGSLKQIVFDEEFFKKALLKANTNESEFEWEVKDFNFNYDVLSVDFTDESMILNASGTVVYIPKINIEELKKKIAGKSINEIKQEIFMLPGIESANISLSPFWILKAPSNLSKIEIKVN
jgi:hypothetical protein